METRTCGTCQNPLLHRQKTYCSKECLAVTLRRPTDGDTPGRIVLASGHVILLNPKDHQRLAKAGELDGLFVSKKGAHLYVQNRQKQYLHRLIMQPAAGMVVDHINRDTLDNRRSNLRVVTIGDNVRNQRRALNVTGKTGVRPYKSRFEAYITHAGKKKHLGRFDTVEAAIEARQAAELHAHGRVYEH